MGDESYWAWRDEQLAHPDGRATGGEPCVVCTAPVPPNAHWKQRDRHVCSTSCNTKFGRRFNDKVTRGTIAKPGPTPDP